MSNITNISPVSNEVASEVVPAVASVAVHGATMTERRQSVMQAGLTEAAAMTLATVKGKAGAPIREAIVDAGIAKAIRMAANGNYLPLVQMFAFHTGQSLTISTKDEFNAMPFVIQQLIEVERAKKSGGKKTDAKTGLQVDIPKVATLMGMHALMVDAVEGAKRAFAERQAKRLAQQEAAAAAAAAGN